MFRIRSREFFNDLVLIASQVGFVILGKDFLYSDCVGLIAVCKEVYVRHLMLVR